MTTHNPSLTNNPDLDSWIAIADDGTVQVRSGKVDIGQKISTALLRLVADELAIDPARIVMVSADTIGGPDEGMTSGSNSMEESGNALRCAAATARAHLIAAAAEELGVLADSIVISDGTVTSRETNRSTSVQELQGGRLFGIPVDPSASRVAAAQASQVGSWQVPADLHDIVTGRHVFVQDMTMAGMLHARVLRPPHRFARLETVSLDSLDDFAAGNVHVVRDGSFLAVAAADESVVITAAETLAAALDWTADRDLGADDIYVQLTSNARESLPVVEGIPVDQPVGEPPVPPDNARAVLSARFERPYIMHGSIGPSAALARYADGMLDIWTHSQGIYPLRASIAEALSMPPGDVRLHHRPGPGCYGHNGADDAAFDAALVACAIPETPVLLKWTRSDEHAWEPYSSAMVMQLSGAVDKNGRITAWSHESFSDTHIGRPRTGIPGEGPARLLAARYRAEPVREIPPRPIRAHHGGIHRNMEPLYDFGTPRLVKHLVRDLPHRTSALRTLGAFANIFALESFVDELAHAAGIDAVALRLRHLADPRARACIEAVAGRIGGLDAIGDGTGRGIAFARYKNTKAYAAVGVELTVDNAARIRLARSVIAGDAGYIVDPVGVRAQFEGGFMQAASWTLFEAVTHAPDGITSRDWETYPIMGFDAVPDIETILLNRPDSDFLGAGEAVCGPTAAAIANAVFRATGVRARRLPLTPDMLRFAALA